MKVLQTVIPTPEQLLIIQRNTPGVTLIRGAAGSGKTTTALLRMKLLAVAWRNRHRRLNLNRPVEMLVITYNKTLKGYISELASQQITNSENLNLEVKTFAKWATELLDIRPEHDKAETILRKLANISGENFKFLLDEAQYVLGRFLPEDLKDYLECERKGRGRAPRCEKPLRERILYEIVYPYLAQKKSQNITDFYDLAITLATNIFPVKQYDVVIVDESQDLSANEVRALMNHLARQHSVTFVLDGAQRIYPKGFTWKEVGITLQPTQSFKLRANHRNTSEIASFIKPLLDDVDIGDEEGSIPDWATCNRHGAKPIMLAGKYSSQLDWVIDYIRNEVDLTNESIAFLKPLGGEWFNALRTRLTKENLGYIELTRNGEWPQGSENIALSTMHSAKGLEFDNVIILGLNDQVTPHGAEAGDSQLDSLRRLTAMALGRAKKRVIVGYKPDEASELVKYFQKGTFKEYTI